MARPRHTYRFRSLLRALTIVVLLLAPGSGAPDRAEPVRDGVRRCLEAATLNGVEGGAALAHRLRPFYRNRAYRPVWVKEHGLLPEADDLLETLRRAETEGLVPAEYHLPQIFVRLSDATPNRLAELDLLLTDAFLLYCTDLRSGRADLRDADPEWFLFSDRIDHLAVLEHALASQTLDQVLSVVPPPAPQYGRLCEALRRYRQIAEWGGWPSLLEGGLLRPGARGPSVATLRQRLRLTADIGQDNGSDRFGPQLEAAVRRFQARNGLQVDGIVGPKTRTALNVPVQERIRQIVLNMERWRWMPRELGRRCLLVNMAGFVLDAVEDGRTVLRMRVIVGRAYRRTPAFSDSMTYLVFNPYWNIPPNIAVLDILPKLREHPGYPYEQKIRVFTDWSAEAAEVEPWEIDWSQVDAQRFPYKLRQDPGPKNSLGRVKFMLPNRFNVYLHDTPDRELFDRPVRTFSSGCIRVEKPLELAAFVLAPDPRWTPARIRNVIASGERSSVGLSEPVPVYVVYWTAWVDAAGTVHFREDVYGRDRLLREALEHGRYPERTG